MPQRVEAPDGRQDLARVWSRPRCRDPFPRDVGGHYRNFTVLPQRFLVPVTPGTHNPRSRRRMPTSIRNVGILKHQTTRHVPEQQDRLELLPLTESKVDPAEIIVGNQRAEAPRLSVVVP